MFLLPLKVLIFFLDSYFIPVFSGLGKGEYLEVLWQLFSTFPYRFLHKSFILGQSLYKNKSVSIIGYYLYENIIVEGYFSVFWCMESNSLPSQNISPATKLFVGQELTPLIRSSDQPISS